MSSDKKKSRGLRAPKGRATGTRREEIIRISTDLFRRRGYHLTSLEDIADEIGFTKPAIYYYFKSKEDILFAIVEQIVDDGLGRAKRIATSPGPVIERLHAVLVAHTETTLQNLAANTVFYNERGLLSAERESLVRVKEREYTAVIKKLYREGVTRGELRDIDLVTAVSTLLGASIWSYRWFKPEGRMSVEEVARTIADMLVNGVRKYEM